MMKTMILSLVVMGLAVTPRVQAQSQSPEQICAQRVHRTPTKSDRIEDVILVAGAGAADIATRGGYSSVGYTAQTVIWNRTNQRVQERDDESREYQTCLAYETDKARLQAQTEIERERTSAQAMQTYQQEQTRRMEIQSRERVDMARLSNEDRANSRQAQVMISGQASQTGRTISTSESVDANGNIRLAANAQMSDAEILARAQQFKR